MDTYSGEAVFMESEGCVMDANETVFDHLQHLMKTRIPKKISSRKGLLRDPDAGEKNLYEDLIKSSMHTNAITNWRIDSIQVVVNKELELQFRDAQKRMQGVTGRKLRSKYVFSAPDDVDKVCREGVHAGMIDQQSSVLGNANMGVHLCRNADLAMVANHMQCNAPMKVLIFKVLLGRSHAVDVDLGGQPLEPVPNCNSHISVSAPATDDHLRAAINKSMVYIYEYDEEEAIPVTHPPQCLPVALVTVTYDTSGIRPLMAAVGVQKRPHKKKQKKQKSPYRATLRSLMCPSDSPSVCSRAINGLMKTMRDESDQPQRYFQATHPSVKNIPQARISVNSFCDNDDVTDCENDIMVVSRNDQRRHVRKKASRVIVRKSGNCHWFSAPAPDFIPLESGRSPVYLPVSKPDKPVDLSPEKQNDTSRCRQEGKTTPPNGPWPWRGSRIRSKSSVFKGSKLIPGYREFSDHYSPPFPHLGTPPTGPWGREEWRRQPRGPPGEAASPEPLLLPVRSWGVTKPPPGWTKIKPPQGRAKVNACNSGGSSIRDTNGSSMKENGISTGVGSQNRWSLKRRKDVADAGTSGELLRPREVSEHNGNKSRKTCERKTIVKVEKSCSTKESSFGIFFDTWMKKAVKVESEQMVAEETEVDHTGPQETTATSDDVHPPRDVIAKPGMLLDADVTMDADINASVDEQKSDNRVASDDTLAIKHEGDFVDLTIEDDGEAQAENMKPTGICKSVNAESPPDVAAGTDGSQGKGQTSAVSRQSQNKQQSHPLSQRYVEHQQPLLVSQPTAEHQRPQPVSQPTAAEHQQPPPVSQPTAEHQQPPPPPIGQPSVEHQQPPPVSQPSVEHQQPPPVSQPTADHQQPVIQPTVEHQQPPPVSQPSVEPQQPQAVNQATADHQQPTLVCQPSVEHQQPQAVNQTTIKHQQPLLVSQATGEHQQPVRQPTVERQQRPPDSEPFVEPQQPQPVSQPSVVYMKTKRLASMEHQQPQPVSHPSVEHQQPQPVNQLSANHLQPQSLIPPSVEHQQPQPVLLPSTIIPQLPLNVGQPTGAMQTHSPYSSRASPLEMMPVMMLSMMQLLFNTYRNLQGLAGQAAHTDVIHSAVTAAVQETGHLPFTQHELDSFLQGLLPGAQYAHGIAPIAQGSVAPVLSQGSVAPIFAQGSVAPVLAKGSAAPALAQGSVAPTFAQGSVAPVLAQGLVAPALAQGSVAPTFAQGSVAPVLAQGSVAPALAQGSVAPVLAQGSVAPVLAQGYVAPVLAQGSVAPVLAQASSSQPLVQGSVPISSQSLAHECLASAVASAGGSTFGLPQRGAGGSFGQTGDVEEVVAMCDDCIKIED